MVKFKESAQICSHIQGLICSSEFGQTLVSVSLQSVLASAVPRTSTDAPSPRPVRNKEDLAVLTASGACDHQAKYYVGPCQVSGD